MLRLFRASFTADVAENCRYFEADLVRRFSPTFYQFNRIALTVERPVGIFEFCCFYTIVSSGRFETNTGIGHLRAASQSDLPLVQAIQQTGFKVPEQEQTLSDEFQDDIACLEGELKHVHQSEMLQMAFATRQPDEGVTNVLDG